MDNGGWLSNIRVNFNKNGLLEEKTSDKVSGVLYNIDKNIETGGLTMHNKKAYLGYLGILGLLGSLGAFHPVLYGLYGLFGFFGYFYYYSEGKKGDDEK